MLLTIDMRWLLEVQDRHLPDAIAVGDFTGLAAAVARHAHEPAALGHEPDPAWRAACLMHTLVRLRPLPERNELYAAVVAIGYMAACGEAIDPPYGALTDTAGDVHAYRVETTELAERIRSWRI
ncbi:toxin Doc [Mangrovactinospora gilvigrisea]|uniref:Toxin Doc n=1 Tax=Mangrovactinospora gilvigrisea TaxID=1428644 RepID=A0A1J7BUH7_9ACTN|nr:toxin Doc [Mangrovactinospora gilvigrisea]OIV37113.1 toxin Doc [Mangrovactinospora gilvigrisea]